MGKTLKGIDNEICRWYTKKATRISDKGLEKIVIPLGILGHSCIFVGSTQR